MEVTSSASTVALLVMGNDEGRSLESETVECGRGSRGTRTREWLRWRGPAAVVGCRPGLWSEGASRIGGPATVWQWWKSGRGPQMGALFRGGLANLPLVVTWDSTRPVHACAATNTDANNGGTVGGGVLYSIRLEFMRQERADWLYRVWRRIRITSTVTLLTIKGEGKGTQCLQVEGV
jgi:hypothetical protein